MVRRNRDAKFIIYQVLYIFVVTVLAFKGAEINLGEVVEKDNVVEKSVRDSLIGIVDSLTELGIDFNIKIDTAIISENKDLKKKLSTLNTQVASLSKKIKQTPKKKPDPEIYNKISSKISPFSKDITFLQYATNSAENKSNVPVNIIDPKTKKRIARLSPGEKKEFELNAQDHVSINYGDRIEHIKVLKNNPPEIYIQKVTTKMDKDDIFVKDLQRTTCFKVYISDERLDQIRVTHSGPISVVGPQKNNKGQLVYNVSLNLAGNEGSFERWADKNDHLMDSDDRYRLNFFFNAFDIKSEQKIEVGESFYFTDFSK